MNRGVQVFSLSPYIIFNTFQPCLSQTGEGTDGGEGRAVDGMEVHYSMRGNRHKDFRMPFLLPTSAKNIHWNSSFL